MTTQTEDFEDASILFSPTGDFARHDYYSHTGTYSYGVDSYNSAREAHFQIPAGASTVSFWYYRGYNQAGFQAKLDATTTIVDSNSTNGWTQVTHDCTGYSTLDMYLPYSTDYNDVWIDDLSFVIGASPPPFANRALRVWRIH